ncbi:MAG: VOC family protein [Gammaproteobacteria bacterium]
MSEIRGLHHVSVLVADTQRSVEFYTSILELAIDRQRPEMTYAGAWLTVGEQQIHLIELPNPDPVSGRPDHVGRDRHMALAVVDLDNIIARLEKQDISYTKSRSGRQAVFFRDPDGNGIELIG